MERVWELLQLIALYVMGLTFLCIDGLLIYVAYLAFGIWGGIGAFVILSSMMILVATNPI